MVCANGDCKSRRRADLRRSAIKREFSLTSSLGDAHLHTACYEGIRKGRNACPNCATSFATDKPQPVGEKAVSEVEDEYRGINKKKRSRASRANDDDDDDDDEGEGGASLEDEFNASQGQTQAQTQSAGVSIRKQGAVVATSADFICTVLETAKERQRSEERRTGDADR